MTKKIENALKKSMLDDLQRLDIIYRETFPEDTYGITRDFYRIHGTFSDIDIYNAFSTFKKFKDEAMSDPNRIKTLSRKSIHIKKNDANKKGGRKYFVTAAIAGGTLNKSFYESVQTYCKLNKAKLVVLPMRGVHITDEGFHEDLQTETFSTEYIFNKNLRAIDMMIAPQQIRPLTGLNRFGQKEYSIIIASPKQQMNAIPVSLNDLPHINHSTGSITNATYADTRQGRLAEQDHITGGLIVEIESDEIFHIRQVQSTNEGGFFDLDKYYCGQTSRTIKATAFIMGDLHSGVEDPTAVRAWKDCIKLTNPQYIILHDIMDSRSINYRDSNSIMYFAKLEENTNSLKKELDIVGKTLQMWSSTFPKSSIVITKGNHDSWLDNFLSSQEFTKPQYANSYKTSLELTKDLLDDKNPLAEYIKRNFVMAGEIIWLEVDDDFKLEKVQCGSHGARGNNGGPSSINSLEIRYGNSITGHAHSPAILRNTWRVGTTTKFNLNYIKGSGSSWMHTSALLYPEGCRQLISSIGGSWRVK